MRRQTRNYIITILSVDIENSRRALLGIKESKIIFYEKTFDFRQEKLKKTQNTKKTYLEIQ